MTISLQNTPTCIVPVQTAVSGPPQYPRAKSKRPTPRSRYKLQPRRGRRQAETGSRRGALVNLDLFFILMTFLLNLRACFGNLVPPGRALSRSFAQKLAIHTWEMRRRGKEGMEGKKIKTLPPPSARARLDRKAWPVPSRRVSLHHGFGFLAVRRMRQQVMRVSERDANFRQANRMFLFVVMRRDETLRGYPPDPDL